MESYDGATLKVTELLSTGQSNVIVCLWRLHGCVLDYIHLSATGVAGIAKYTNLKGCPNIFGHVLYCTFTGGGGAIARINTECKKFPLSHMFYSEIQID
jgi:hypothetical protein